MFPRIRLAFDHLIFLIRGCQHPIMELEGAWLIEIAGERVSVVSEVCTVCGLTIVTTTP